MAQVFEGMALGSLVAVMKNATFCKYLVLGILYPLVTPLGMAIGIGIHSSFNDRSSTVIVVQGIMDSLSYAVIVRGKRFSSTDGCHQGGRPDLQHVR